MGYVTVGLLFYFFLNLIMGQTWNKNKDDTLLKLIAQGKKWASEVKSIRVAFMKWNAAECNPGFNGN